MTEYTQRPKAVIRAICFLVFAVIIGFIYDVYGYIVLRPYGFGLSEVLRIIVPHALLLILIQQIYKGKNWARVLYAVIFVLIYVYPPIDDIVYEGYKYNTLGLVKIIIQNVTILIGMYFVFGKESNIWFRATKVNRGLTTG